MYHRSSQSLDGGRPRPWRPAEGRGGRFPPTGAIVSCHELRAPHWLRLPGQEERRLRPGPLAAVGDLLIHGLRDSFGAWVYETYEVKQAQEWLEHSDPATTLRHYVRLTTAARAEAVAGLDEVTRAALESAERRAAEDAAPVLDNVVSLASRRG
jgi:integrase